MGKRNRYWYRVEYAVTLAKIRRPLMERYLEEGAVPVSVVVSPLVIELFDCTEVPRLLGAQVYVNRAFPANVVCALYDASDPCIPEEVRLVVPADFLPVPGGV